VSLPKFLPEKPAGCGWDSANSVDSLLETIDIRGIRLVVCWFLSGPGMLNPPRRFLPVESNDWLNHATAEEPAAVIVDIEAEIDSGPKGVLAVDPSEVVTICGVVIARACGARAVRPVDIQRRSQHAIVSPEWGTFRGFGSWG